MIIQITNKEVWRKKISNAIERIKELRQKSDRETEIKFRETKAWFFFTRANDEKPPYNNSYPSSIGHADFYSLGVMLLAIQAEDTGIITLTDEEISTIEYYNKKD